MTREEAIIYFKRHLDLYCVEGISKEAEEMAIKALEQEHYEDTISRQAVLEAIKNLYPDMPIVDIMGARQKWLEKYAPYRECEKVVEQLPSVTPQPKTGHWTERKIHKTTGFFLPTCSECGNIQPYTHHTFSWNYCPTCGAKMQEVEE